VAHYFHIKAGASKPWRVTFGRLNFVCTTCLIKDSVRLTESPSYEGCLIVLMENQIDYPELQSVLELSTYEEWFQFEST